MRLRSKARSNRECSCAPPPQRSPPPHCLRSARSIPCLHTRPFVGATAQPPSPKSVGAFAGVMREPACPGHDADRARRWRPAASVQLSFLLSFRPCFNPPCLVCESRAWKTLRRSECPCCHPLRSWQGWQRPWCCHTCSLGCQASFPQLGRPGARPACTQLRRRRRACRRHDFGCFTTFRVGHPAGCSWDSQPSRQGGCSCKPQGKSSKSMGEPGRYMSPRVAAQEHLSAQPHAVQPLLPLSSTTPCVACTPASAPWRAW